MKRTAMATVVVATAILCSTTLTASAHEDRHQATIIPPAIRITQGSNCQGAITVTWDYQVFNEKTRSWEWINPNVRPIMTLQGFWKGSWIDMIDTRKSSSQENDILYVGKGLPTLRMKDKAHDAASIPWDISNLAGC